MNEATFNPDTPNLEIATLDNLFVQQFTSGEISRDIEDKKITIKWYITHFFSS